MARLNTTLGRRGHRRRADQGRVHGARRRRPRTAWPAAVRPTHTLFDGDIVFALATGHAPAGPRRRRTPYAAGPSRAALVNDLAAAGADAVCRAIVHAVLAATTVGDSLARLSATCFPVPADVPRCRLPTPRRTQPMRWKQSLAVAALGLALLAAACGGDNSGAVATTTSAAGVPPPPPPPPRRRPAAAATTTTAVRRRPAPAPRPPAARRHQRQDIDHDRRDAGPGVARHHPAERRRRPQALLYNVYETLVKIDDTGAYQPLLAADYKVSTDGLTYTFTLNDGLVFADGTPLTADTVKKTFDYNKANAKAPAIIKATFDPVASVTATDPKTVVVKLTQPSRELPVQHRPDRRRHRRRRQPGHHRHSVQRQRPVRRRQLHHQRRRSS